MCTTTGSILFTRRSAKKSRRIYSLSLSIVPLYLLRCFCACSAHHVPLVCGCARGRSTHNHTAFSLPSITIPMVTQPCVPFSPPLMHTPPKVAFLFILPPTKQKKRTSSIAHSQFIPLMTEMMPSFWLHTHLTTSRATAYDPFSLYPLNSLAIKACCSLCQKYRYADHSPIPPLAVTHMLLLNTFIYA